MWEHNGQGPWEREAEEKLGGKVTWFHTISAAFSFPSSFSPPPLAQPTPPSIFLGTNSKATRFGQRKGGVDISWLPQCNGGRQSWKPRLTSSTASSLMSAFNTETTSPPNRSERGCSYLYLYFSFQGIWMSKDTSNFSSTPLVLPFHVGSTGFRRNVWLCRIFSPSSKKMDSSFSTNKILQKRQNREDGGHGAGPHVTKVVLGPSSAFSSCCVTFQQ